MKINMFNLALLWFQVFVTQGSGFQGTVNFLQVFLPAVLIITVFFLPEKKYCMSFHGECIFIPRPADEKEIKTIFSKYNV